jgi:hypothetical protein
MQGLKQGHLKHEGIRPNRLMQHFLVIATIYFGLFLDHHQVFAVSLMYALYLTCNDNCQALYRPSELDGEVSVNLCE